MAKKAAKKSTRKKAPRKKAAPRGRPRGSRNIARDEVDVLVSHCKRCDSTEREPYSGDAQSMDYCGTDPQTGRRYNRIVWRRTQCRKCGQHRIDKCYEFVEPK